MPPELPYPPPLDEALLEQQYKKYILKINDEVSKKAKISNEGQLKKKLN